MQIDMNGVRVYTVKYIVETPLMIRTDYLPGSIIRGAVLTSLLTRFDIRREAKNPSMVFHPAFPVHYTEGEEIIYKPAHPFIYKCKICHEVTDTTPLLYCMDGNKLKDYDELKNELTRIIPYICSGEQKHPFSLKSVGGELVAIYNGKVKRYNNELIVFSSVGMNKILGSSEVNMIYTYQCIKPGTTFKGIIVQCGDDIRLDELIRMNDNLIIAGRGGSRGFGRVRLDISIDNHFIERRRGAIYKRLMESKGLILLRALTPLFNIALDKDMGLISNYHINNLLRGISVKSCIPIITRETEISGFSLISNIQKVKIPAADRGSLIFIDIAEQIDNMVDRLIALELFGLGLFSSTGLNMVEVM